MSVSLEQPLTTRAEVLRPAPRHVYWLSMALALVAATSAALTFFVPGILTGPSVTNGNARGTALVMLVAAVPVLLISMSLTARGSWRAPVVWLGALGYLLYNGFLLLFLTPFNSLFLLYVATFSLCLFAIAALVRVIDAPALAARFRGIPSRGLALYVWTIVFLNLLTWLRTIVPALGADDPPSFMDGSGVVTNPIFVQDLVFWFPMAALGAWWLWKGRPWGVPVVGAWLVYGLLESIGVATDQWFGYRANPDTTFATVGGMWLFIALGAIGLIPLYFFFRADRARKMSPEPRGQ
jgi:hypothetical protein